jgi:hypothetical protein
MQLAPGVAPGDEIALEQRERIKVTGHDIRRRRDNVPVIESPRG